MTNIFLSAFLLSIWSTFLFFDKNIGLSMLLFVTPFTYYLIYILEKNNLITNKKAKILLIPIVLLSITYFMFNNTFFNALNLFLIPILIIIMIIELFYKTTEIKSLFKQFKNILFFPLKYLQEAINTFINSIKKKLNLKTNEENKNNLFKIIKSIFIIAPIILLIIILLGSADVLFGKMLGHILEFSIKTFGKLEFSSLFIKIILTIFITIYFSSFFYIILNKLKNEENISIKNKDSNHNLTIKMLLISLNIIYLIFCFIQIKSLFLRTVDMNYAEYARQGFFQLMIISIINLFTILVAKKAENKTKEKTDKFITVMCLIMITFTFIIILSSTIRIYFYESAYGYTLLRLLVYFALFTETILLIPTILHILDKKVNLVKTYFTIIVSIYICINFANLNNIIANRNIDRYFEIGKIDMLYLTNETGTDAISQVVKLLRAPSDEIRSETQKYLNVLYRDLNSENIDIRNFTFSKYFAKKLIQENFN